MAVNHADRFDELLDAQLTRANRSIAPPPDLESRISRTIGRTIVRRRIGVAGGVLVVVIASGGVLRTLIGPASPTAPSKLAIGDADIAPSPGPDRPAARGAATVRFAPDSGYFAREIPTSHPNVSMVRVYRNLAVPMKAEEEEPGDSPDAASPGSQLTPLIQRSDAWHTE